MIHSIFMRPFPFIRSNSPQYIGYSRRDNFRSNIEIYSLSCWEVSWVSRRKCDVSWSTYRFERNWLTERIAVDLYVFHVWSSKIPIRCSIIDSERRHIQIKETKNQRKDNVKSRQYTAQASGTSPTIYFDNYIFIAFWSSGLTSAWSFLSLQRSWNNNKRDWQERKDWNAEDDVNGDEITRTNVFTRICSSFFPVVFSGGKWLRSWCLAQIIENGFRNFPCVFLWSRDLSADGD